MKLLRSLISLETEDDKDGNINIHRTKKYQTYPQLIIPKYLPTNNKSSSSKRAQNAYSNSSINLAKNKKRICGKRDDLQYPADHSADHSAILYNDGIISPSTSYNSLFTTIDVDFDELTFDCETDIINNLQIDYDIELKRFPTEDFRFMYNIGNGAFGIVHKEFHLKSCQIVAVKLCRSANVHCIKSFKNEINICKEFSDSPFIINMIEYGIDIDTNTVCIALEYMNMASLNRNRDIFTKNTLTRIKQVSFCILNALVCLHNKLYIHNDIKPDNILINDRWEIKLSDFGCIKQMKDANTLETKALGTEYYQSYEKRFTSPIRYNTKSDIYSFGITICDLINEYKTNEDIVVPFKIPKQILQKYRKTNYDFIDFLEKCLERNYKERWSASELLNHQFLSHKSVHNIKNEFPANDIDDLECMINTLIHYYLHYEYTLVDFNKNISMFTPMDNAWSDAERIQNIAKYSGYSSEFVQDYIFQSVNGLKNKYLKL